MRRRAHLAAGMRVKIVRERDAASGTTVEGTIAELLSDGDDEAGILVRLETGEVGRALRVWEAGLPAPPGALPRERVSLPTHDEREPDPSHWKFRIPASELEAKLREVVGPLDEDDLRLMIERHQDGLSGDLLKRFGLRSDEVEARTRDLLAGIDDEALERKLEGSSPEDERSEDRRDWNC